MNYGHDSSGAREARTSAVTVLLAALVSFQVACGSGGDGADDTAAPSADAGNDAAESPDAPGEDGEPTQDAAGGDTGSGSDAGGGTDASDEGGDAGLDASGPDTEGGDAGPVGPAEGAWGLDSDPLPEGAELVDAAEIEALRQSGELLQITPATLAAAAQTAADRLAEDAALVAEYVKEHPELAERFYAEPKNPDIEATGDGNWAVPVLMPDGTLRKYVTHGEAARIRTIAGTIRRTQSKDNQKLAYQALFPLASEKCQAAGPSLEKLDELTADELRAAKNELVACWKAETYPDETPDPATFDDPELPADPPAPPSGYVADAADYEGAGDGLVTDGSDAGCEPASTLFTAWSGRYYLTAVKDQANRGSCVAFGTVSALENSAARKLGKWVNLSEQAFYAKAKLSWDEEDYGDGLDTQDTVETLFETNYSIPFEETWNYNPSWSRMDDGDSYSQSCVNYEGPACSNTAHQAKLVCQTAGGSSFCYYWRPASPGNSGYTAGKFVELCDFEGDDLDAAKMMLSAGYGLVIAADVTEGWQNAPSDGFFASNDGDEIGGHAFHVVRWIPNSSLPQARWGAGGGRVMVKNSWACWADGGYAYLTAEWTNDHIKSLSAILPKKMGTNQTPTITIEAPTPGQSFGYGGFMNFHEFSATASDLEDGEACCTFSWSSSKDGDLGDGPAVQVAFSTPGPRTITVTATDSDGGKSQRSVIVYADNLPPNATIDTPSQNGAVAYKDVPFLLSGTGADPNEVLDLPCAQLTWTSSNAADPFPLTGCDITPTFTTLGTRTITLTVKDQKGLTDTATRTVSVQNPPLNAPPQVTITYPPSDDFYLEAEEIVTLKATAVDPDGAGAMTYKWTVQKGAGKEEEIGTTTSLKWKPSNNIPFNCGGTGATLRFYATDDDGTTVKVRTVFIAYPPC
jgi:C1A family cysteine protease